MNENITPENTYTAGKYLAHIHNARSFEKAGWWEWQDGKPVVIGFPGDSLKARIRKNLEDKLKYFRTEEIGWLEKVTEKFLENYIDRVPENFEPVFVHHDYNPGNILESDGDIKGILGFDYTHSSHGQRDLVKAANNFWIRGGVEPGHLYEGYRQVRELGESFERNEPVYRLETLIDILKGLIEHGYMTEQEARGYKGNIQSIEEEIKAVARS